MNKSEILAALAFLQSEERREVRAKLDQLDGLTPDDWLDDNELSAAEKRPETSIPWAVATEALTRRYGS